MAVKHITLGGESRPIHFTVNALMEFEELTQLNFNDINTADHLSKLSNVRALTYVGLKHGARSEGVEFKHALEDVGDWLSFMDDSINQVMTAFNNNNGAAATDVGGNTDVSKKK